MNEELTKKLYEKYPTIFSDKDKPDTESLMCYGLDHGDGWYDIIDKLCEKLRLIERATGIKTIAEQVKEKFAGLCFYIRYEVADNTTIQEYDIEIWKSMIRDIISETESRSYSTCEDCGEYGKTYYRKTDGGIVRNAWHSTLCKKCAEKLKYTEENIK